MNTIAVAINACYGGFSLSRKAAIAILERKGIKYRLEKGNGYGGKEDNNYPFIGNGWTTVMDVCERTDPDLIAVIRELGDEANGSCAKIKIVDFSIDVEIDNFDGKETVKIYGVEK